MKTDEEVLKVWEDTTRKLCEHFAKKYYSDDEDKSYVPDYWWVGDDVSDVMFVNDDSYSLNRIVSTYRLNPTYEQLINYSELELEQFEIENKTGTKPPIANFKNYVKYGFTWLDKK